MVIVQGGKCPGEIRRGGKLECRPDRLEAHLQLGLAGIPPDPRVLGVQELRVRGGAARWILDAQVDAAGERTMLVHTAVAVVEQRRAG